MKVLSGVSAYKTSVHSPFVIACRRVHCPEEIIFRDAMYLFIVFSCDLGKKNNGKHWKVITNISVNDTIVKGLSMAICKYIINQRTGYLSIPSK